MRIFTVNKRSIYFGIIIIQLCLVTLYLCLQKKLHNTTNCNYIIILIHISAARFTAERRCSENRKTIKNKILSIINRLKYETCYGHLNHLVVYPSGNTEHISDISFKDVLCIFCVPYYVVKLHF